MSVLCIGDTLDNLVLLQYFIAKKKLCNNSLIDIISFNFFLNEIKKNRFINECARKTKAKIPKSHSFRVFLWDVEELAFLIINIYTSQLQYALNWPKLIIKEPFSSFSSLHVKKGKASTLIQSVYSYINIRNLNLNINLKIVTLIKINLTIF